MASGPDSLGLRGRPEGLSTQCVDCMSLEVGSRERVAGAVGELDKAFLAR